jgi:hypothetical protein
MARRWGVWFVVMADPLKAPQIPKMVSGIMNCVMSE